MLVCDGSLVLTMSGSLRIDYLETPNPYKWAVYMKHTICIIKPHKAEIFSYTNNWLRVLHKISFTLRPSIKILMRYVQWLVSKINQLIHYSDTGVD